VRFGAFWVTNSGLLTGPFWVQKGINC